jgi:hypothetical protein
MRPEDLVFWIDSLPDPVEPGAGVLCLRHANSMVMPRGWTLDDLRDPELRLFRPPLPAPTARSRSPRPPSAPRGGEQLQFGDVEEPRAPVDADPDPAPEHVAEVVDEGPWTPSFDETDDLDGLLAARSPLLARAFRTADRPAE